ncbi:MAG: pentapeptide repeat-containing protein, partial [Nitrospirota bacterium]|nr:pentapeptide repeat-containing protein [Nitrospirota bacterium]
MSEPDDTPSQPNANPLSLEDERTFLLEAHRTWKRTQPTEQSNPAPLDEQPMEEFAPHTPKDFFQVDRREADFRHQDLRNANFQEAYLPGADFEGADLRGANFHGANLRSARFHRSQLAW